MALRLWLRAARATCAKVELVRSTSKGQRTPHGSTPTRALQTVSGASPTEPVPNGLKVAVLYQAIPPPVINGVRKPMKPGGYQDSGADVAFNLQREKNVDVLTPIIDPNPAQHEGWSFPDTEDGILAALDRGATHLWANTILFASHPLQASQRVRQFQDQVHVVGQPPGLVEMYDDKLYVNNFLRKQGSFTMPRGWSLELDQSTIVEHQIASLALPYPVVAKPVRGRGSFGVKVCHSPVELEAQVEGLYEDSSLVMLEEFMAGEETTTTVMPPSPTRNEYWSLPIVTRFNHADGIAPYNGVIAVTSNSRVISMEEVTAYSGYSAAMRECEAVAKLLRVTAPIRIDMRRRDDTPGSPFMLFDVNMKPNMTGPGRPGREDQASLTALAGAGLGWDYSRLLREMLASGPTLRHLRHVRPPSIL